MTDRKRESHARARERTDGVGELVEAARAGDKDAFGEIYRATHGPIFRMARFHLGPAAAEDAVAETFMRAWRSLHRYRDRGRPFVAWLYGIARHVVGDALRARRRVEPLADVPAAARDPFPSADGRLALQRALAALPQKQRQVVELKYLMGLTNEEVASALGTSPGAVNTLRWRALRALREIIGGWDG